MNLKPQPGPSGPSWLDNLGLKGMAKLTGVGFAISAIIGAGREIMTWPDLARQQSAEARKVEAALKKQFEWSKGTRDNLAGIANAWTGITSILQLAVGTMIAQFIGLQKRMLRMTGLGFVVDKFFPDTSNEQNPVAREMELRREAELAEIDANDYFKKRAKEREIKVAMSEDIQNLIPAMFSRDSRSQAGIYATAGGEFWQKQVVGIQKQLLDELKNNTEATKETTSAVREGGI
jgi:hypothetical protein